MPRLLITGFEAFAGRKVNASWQLAQTLAAVERPGLELRALKLPVRWGQPRRLLAQTLARWPADAVLALGEGKPGQFTVETLARKQRAERADNAGRFPLLQPVEINGPDQLQASVDWPDLVQALNRRQIPLQPSCDAGAYLCEETLYTLERMRQLRNGPRQVLFVHVPPWHSALDYQQQATHCNLPLLLEVGEALLDWLQAQLD